MPYIEAKSLVGKTIMSLFFTGMALVGLIGGIDSNSGGAWFVFLAFGAMAIYAWRNTLAHQRYLEQQARLNRQ